MALRQWHHTCCYRHSQCYRRTEAEANEHAEERADHLRTSQAVRWSERMSKWVIEHAPTQEA
jgi:hypothetical protein